MSSEPEDLDSFFGTGDDGGSTASHDGQTSPPDAVSSHVVPAESAEPDEPDDSFQESLRPKACEPAEWEKRVQTVIAMLTWGETRGDIKRKCSVAWNIKGRSVEPYLAAANKRIEQTEAPEIDVADALLHWRNRKLEAEQEIQQEKKTIRVSENAIEQLKVRLVELNSKEEELPKGEPAEILKLQKANASKQLNALLDRTEKARGLIEKATARSDAAQQHIERIKGVHAPIKYAKTDASGRDIESWTAEEIAERLNKLGIQPLPKRLPAPVPAASVPSHVPAKATAEPVIDAEFTPVNVSKNGHAKNSHANGKSNGHTNGYIPPVVNGFGSGDNATHPDD